MKFPEYVTPTYYDKEPIKVETLITKLQELDPKGTIERDSAIGAFDYIDTNGEGELICLCTIKEPGDRCRCYCGCA